MGCQQSSIVSPGDEALKNYGIGDNKSKLKGKSQSERNDQKRLSIFQSNQRNTGSFKDEDEGFEEGVSNNSFDRAGTSVSILISIMLK